MDQSAQYFFLVAIILVVTIFITRAIFSIPAMLRYFRAIIKLLAIHAVQNGANESDVQKILNEAKGDNEKL